MQNLSISIIQTNLIWQNPEANRSVLEQQIDKISTATDLVVLPEMFTTGFTMESNQHSEPMDGLSIKWMADIAYRKNCVITGSLIVEENDLFYNRLIWMRPDGTYEHYDKRHLFRFAGETECFTAGNNKLIVELKGWRICPLICFDLRFPVWSRNQENYDCLIYIANWPEARSKAWKTLLEARAHENQCFVIGVNRVGKDGNDIQYSGDSALISPKGELLSNLNPYEENIETITLNLEELNEFRRKFPVALEADKFKINL